MELRETSGDAATAIADSMIARKATFILKNGSIVDLDGVSPLYFDNEVAGNLYVVVYHRNHLPVMSSAPLTKINGNYSWDFTTSESQAYGTNAQKDLGILYGMYGGDSDANGIIDMDDKNNDWTNDAGKTGYYPGDLNMDKEVSNPDKDDIWEPNLGEISQLPTLIVWSCGMQMLDERDGKSYTTVQIGNQCWMAENLNIGTMINGSSNQTNNDTIEKYCYNNSTSNCDTYGGLYQWDEAMQYVTTAGTQGICPTGWHIPTDDEYKTMEMQLGMTQAQADESGWRGTDESSKMAGNEPLWANGNLDQNANFGTSGLNVLPAGYRYTNGSFYFMGNYSNLWSSNEDDPYAWLRTLNYNRAQVAIRRTRTVCVV